MLTMTTAQQIPSFDSSILNGLRFLCNFTVVVGHAFSYLPTINDELPNIILENLKAGTEPVLTFSAMIISSLNVVRC